MQWYGTCTDGLIIAVIGIGLVSKDSEVYLQYFPKKFLQLCKGLRTVRECSFARNVETNFKLCAQMGCVIIYYVTRTQIANLLHKSPVHESVCEPAHEPFHAPRVSS